MVVPRLIFRHLSGSIGMSISILRACRGPRGERPTAPAGSSMNHPDEGERPQPAKGTDAGVPETDSASAESTSTDGPPSGNDQVLGILEKLRQQLNELGSVQRQHDERLASLAERTQEQDPAGEPPATHSAPKEPLPEEPPPAPSSAGFASWWKQQALTDSQAASSTDPTTPSTAPEQAAVGGGVTPDPEVAPTNDEPNATELEAAHTSTVNSTIESLQSQVKELTEEVARRDEQRAEQGPNAETAEDSAGSREVDANPMIKRQRSQIQRLTEQLAALKADGGQEAIRRRDARIEELEGALEATGSDPSASSSVGKVVGGFMGAIGSARGKKAGRRTSDRSRDQRIDELAAECDRLREIADRATKKPGGEEQIPGDGQAQQQIEELRKKLAEAGAAKRDQTELQARQAQELRDQKQRMLQAQEALSTSERVMIRKWARPRAVATLGWLVLVAVVWAGVSLLAANHFVPATISAAVEIEAKSRFGGPIAEADAAGWEKWLRGILTKKGFHKILAQRLAAQRLDEYEDPTVIGDRLQNDLKVDSIRSGLVTLTLAGKDPDEVTAILDVVATTVSRESTRQAGRRSDGARALVRGERQGSDGRSRYATLNAITIQDPRPIAAGVLFGVLMLISVLLVGRIHRSLLKTKQTIDNEQDLFDPDGLYGGAKE